MTSPGTDRARAKDYVELHAQVQSSMNLLDSLESFLSSFQRDLSSVSGQISELQERSKDIDGRLKSRRRIEKPLSKLVSELTIPPALILTILDTEVGESWIPVIDDFEGRLDTLEVRARVKAARDLGDISEGLRIVAATKLRAFFLALLQPIKDSVTTNVQVLQSSVYMKYRSLFSFLQRKAEPVAKEIQDSYIAAARTYYETAFRRYIRSLGWLKSKVTEKFEALVTLSVHQGGSRLDHERLSYAKIDGPSVILAYMADDKTHKEPLEAILRSLFLVLMDNATAEYSFITTFFLFQPLAPVGDQENSSSAPLLSPDHGVVDDGKSIADSEARTEVAGPNLSMGRNGLGRLMDTDKSARNELVNLWKKVFDPVLEYTKAFLVSVVEPPPPAIPLLTMVRLTEAVLAEVQKRQCSPLETFFFTMRLQLWPVFQKVMTEHCDSLKKVAEKPSGYFAKTNPTTDVMISNICQSYTVMFQSFVLLTSEAEETMIFSNLFRLQQELDKLILRHTESVTDPIARATKRSAIYEILLQGLIKSSHLTQHPKVQTELEHWSEKEQSARQTILSTGQRNKVRQ
ncbi:Vps52-domain-containing protein [Pisolithus croceorrhizus]|nr:Vps52-domain-containing protein [Pisolithus croceorrhizus]